MRSFLAALLGFPIARIVRFSLRPDDILVLESDRRLSDREVATIADQIRATFPGHRTIVLEDLRLRIVSPEDAGAGLVRVLEEDR